MYIYVIIFGKIWTIKLKSVKICTVKPASNGTCMNQNTVHIGKFSWSRELRDNINVNIPGFSGTWLTRKRKDILWL